MDDIPSRFWTLAGASGSESILTSVPDSALIFLETRLPSPKEFPMPRNVNRRQFLHASAAIGVASLGTGFLHAAKKKVSANDRLHVGVIGVTGQGAYDMGGVAGAGAAIVALCDT